MSNGPLFVVRCPSQLTTDNGLPTCSAETPERRSAPLRCSDVSFIVKHLPRAADPEAIARQAYAPTQGGWPHEIPQFRAADDEASAYIDLTNSFLKSRAGCACQCFIYAANRSGTFGVAPRSAFRTRSPSFASASSGSSGECGRSPMPAITTVSPACASCIAQPIA